MKKFSNFRISPIASAMVIAGEEFQPICDYSFRTLEELRKDEFVKNDNAFWDVIHSYETKNSLDGLIAELAEIGYWAEDVNKKSFLTLPPNQTETIRHSSSSLTHTT